MSENKRRRSLVWPLVLISLGIVFLLNNLGIVSWDVWSLLWRMWPVLVVAIGLDLIFGRRSGIWSAITVVILIVLFAGAFWLFGISGDAWVGEKVSMEVAQELGEADHAEILIRMNVGSLSLDSLESSSGMLIEGRVEASEFENVKEQFDVSGNSIEYSLTSSGQQYHPGWLFSGNVDQEKSWDLLLNPDVEMDLQVDTGVGKTQLNLSDLTLSHLDVDSGVGEVIIYLPEEGKFDANLNAGVGKIEVFIPQDASVRIKVDKGLGSISIDGDIDFRNGYYYTAAYDIDGDSFDLYLDSGVGNLRIVLMEN